MSVDRSLAADVRASLVASGADPSARSVADALRRERRVLDHAGMSRLVQEMQSDLSGFGPLDPWVVAPGVTDIVVNGHRQVFVDRGRGLEPVDVTFRDDESIRRLVQRLATSAGRRIDDASPYVDAPLPGGVRLHAVLPPISDRICVSLRMARRTAFTLDELVAAQTIAPQLAPVLDELIGLGLTFVISGGTGSGKTTLLSTLLSLADPALRLVVVEDTAELAPSHPHVIRLQTRVSNIEGQGSVTMRDLVRQALRMRPDRIVVGEVRGAEIVDLLSALNTGHEGGCGTLHANRPGDVPARVEALASSGGLDRGSAHSQLASALDAVIHLARRRDGSRYVESVAVLERAADGLVVATPAFEVDECGAVEVRGGLDRWNQLLRLRQ